MTETVEETGRTVNTAVRIAAAAVLALVLLVVAILTVGVIKG